MNPFVTMLMVGAALVTGGLAQHGKSHVGRTTLASAVSSGKANLRIKALGGSSGGTLEAEVWRGANAPKGPLVIEVPPGSMTSCGNEGMQNMVIARLLGEIVEDSGSIGTSRRVARSKASVGGAVSLAAYLGQGGAGIRYRPVTEITLVGKKHKRYLLEAFCANFDLANPEQETEYTLGKPDPMLACIFKEIARRDRELSNAGREPLSIAAKQAAVWIHTDSVTFEHMNEKFEVSEHDFQIAQNIVAKCRNMEQ